MVDVEMSPVSIDEDSDENCSWDLEAVRAEDQRATKYVRSTEHAYVRPVCYRQTGEQRFGPQAKEGIRAFLREHFLIASTEAGDGYEDGDGGGSSSSDSAGDEHGIGDGSDDPWEESIEGNESNDDPDGDEEDLDLGIIFEPILAGLSNSVGDGPAAFPRMQRVRNGLTALSQRFNLYFAAYQDKIYVYRPQRPPQILPEESLVLRPRRSIVAKKVGGYQNRIFGHQVNHLIVGDLGDLEVLLLCYDDGDVVAYYTHQIAQFIAQRSCNPHSAFPRQFFHSNVGKSAWGLAIHKQSRLLAVTCNKHEVTVFAFSITDYEDGYNPAEPDEDDSEWARPVATAELERHFRSRTRNWHIILSVNEDGHNMPNVTFCDDADGNAEKVVAVDIGGKIWIIDIWKLGSNPVVYPEPGTPSPTSVGWGVLVLSDDDFKPTGSYCEALGLPKKQIITSLRPPSRGRLPRWDITCSLFYLRESAPDQYSQLQELYPFPYYEHHLKALPVNRHSPDGDMPWVYARDTGREGRQDGALFTPTVTIAGGRAANARHSTPGSGSGEDDPGPWELFTNLERREKVNFSRIIAPGPGHLSGVDASPEGIKQILDGDVYRRAQTFVKSYKVNEPPKHYSKMSVFYTDQCGIELQPLDFASGPVIRCENVLSNHNHHQGPYTSIQEPWDQSSRISQRVSMIHHVRELNLVVCGSLCGRVALITLTKACRHHADMPFRHGFRVEAVLPRRSDEEKRMRPWAPLHGIAVSPVPDHRARGVDLHRLERGCRQPRPGQAYRLMLHYLDHSILMYHFSRSETDDDLMVF